MGVLDKFLDVMRLNPEDEDDDFTMMIFMMTNHLSPEKVPARAKMMIMTNHIL